MEAVATEGFEVSATQLERWRRRGWIPRNSRHGLGRGLGSRSRFDQGTVSWVSGLASATGCGKRGSDILVKAYMHCVATGRTEAVVIAGAEAAVAAAMLEVLERIVPSCEADATEAAIDRAYADIERQVASGPSLHPHLMEDIHSEIAGRPVPSRRQSIANTRAALVQLTIATRFPDVVGDEMVIDSYADLGILPGSLADELRARVGDREPACGNPTLALLLPTPDTLKSAIATATSSEISAAATLTMMFLSLRVWLTLLSLSNADDPVVVGMKLALGLPDTPFMTMSLGPRDFVTQLSALLANPDAMSLIASNVAAAFAVLASDDSDDHLVHRQLKALQALAQQPSE